MSIQKKTQVLWTLILLFPFILVLKSEGTRQVAPNGTITVDGNTTSDVAALHIDNPQFNSFASYDNPNPNSRLHIHISDPQNEKIYLGFSAGHINETNPFPQQQNFEYRILDPQGNVVYGPIFVSQGNPPIGSWSEAFAGPSQLVGSDGYLANEVSSLELTSGGNLVAGDYYIQFQNLSSNNSFLIDFWDITVVNNSTGSDEVRNGRVWSYNWAFFAINDFGFPERPFNGSFYVCAPDPEAPESAFITKIDFNGSGFMPAAFNIAFNSFGTINTGNIVEDRRSRENMNSAIPEYAIFLNDPIDVCETAATGDVTLEGLTRCDFDDFCINYISTRTGQLDVLLDFDGGDNIFTPGTRDVLLNTTIGMDQVGQAGCLSWDGNDGFGNPLSQSSLTEIPIFLSYAQGIYHFPIYDAELMTNGFQIENVRPIGPTPKLFYDDTEISVESGSGEPDLQLSGCTLPCHTWTNYVNGGFVGFGNLNTINSWWFSIQIEKTEVFFMPSFLECELVGPDQACEGEDVTLDLITSVSPDTTVQVDIIEVEWIGNGIVSQDEDGIILNEEGEYTAEITWVNETGDTCFISCTKEITYLPAFSSTIDTLLEFGDSLIVNDIVYDTEGVFVQTLTAQNGCDSILNIIVDIEAPDIEVVCEISGPLFICENDSVELSFDFFVIPEEVLFVPLDSFIWSGPAIVNNPSDSVIIIDAGGVYDLTIYWTDPITNDPFFSECRVSISDLPVSNFEIDTLIGCGQSVEINNEIYDQAGSYEQLLIAENGCDSTIIVNVEIADPDYICEVTGTSVICSNEFSNLEVIPSLVGSDLSVPQITSISWTGPGIIGQSDTTVVQVNQEGIYTASLNWLDCFGNEESTSCDFELQVLPSFEVSIDTIITEGQVVEVNGELYSETGQFFQEFTSVNGCDSIVVINILQENAIVYYDLNDCKSSDYGNFQPTYPDPLICGQVIASNVFRENPELNRHSCTPGIDDTNALCISSVDDCAYDAGNEKSLIFELIVSPEESSYVRISSLQFYERAPEEFQWIVGTEGLNNYPTRYGLRVLKNGQEIYMDSDIPTSLDWNLTIFNFSGQLEFEITEPSVLRFELLPYCLIGNDSDVSAWDVDEISIQADCIDAVANRKDLSGSLIDRFSEPMENVNVKWVSDRGHNGSEVTDDLGHYEIKKLINVESVSIQPDQNSNYLSNVSTQDLIKIQRHILGLEQFDTPYDYLAADADNSKDVTVTDVLQLRKLILGIYDKLPNNASWRFVRPNNELSVYSPWILDNEDFAVNLESRNELNLTGIKVGDVTRPTNKSLNSEVILKIEKLENNPNDFLQRVGLSILSEEVIGGQFKLLLGDLDFVSLTSEQGIDLSPYFHFNLTENSLTVSIDNIEMNRMDGMVLTYHSLNKNSINNLSLAKEFSSEVYNNVNYDNLQLSLEIKDIGIGSQDITIHPNPFNNILNVDIYSSFPQKATVTVFDLSGKSVYNSVKPLNKGENTLNLDLQFIKGSGLYIIEISDSERLVQEKIFKY